MLYRPLPANPSIQVSAVALGTMSVSAGLMHASLDEQQAIDTVHAAIDCGINLLDTAPAYGDGESEQRLGKALAGKRRDSVLVATKASGPTLAAGEIEADCDKSLRRMNLSHIDLYQIHWQKHLVPLAETLEAMNRLVQAGKVRMVGLCNSGPIDLGESMKHAPIVTDQVVYNLLSRAAEFTLLPFCRENGVGVLCYSPLAQGLLTGRYRNPDELPPERARSRHFVGTRPMSRHGENGCERETFTAIESIRQIALDAGLPMADLANAWLLQQPGVTSILVGASRPQQVQANVRAVDIKLSPELLARLDQATADVKAKLGPNLDMWQGSSDTRVR